MVLDASPAVSASKEMTVGLAPVLAPVEVLDVVDQAAVVLEDLLEPAALAALDRVVAGLVDVVGDGVVLDRVDDLVGLRAARRARRSRGPC